jgi:hypothetical protein
VVATDAATGWDGGGGAGHEDVVVREPGSGAAGASGCHEGATGRCDVGAGGADDADGAGRGGAGGIASSGMDRSAGVPTSVVKGASSRTMGATATGWAPFWSCGCAEPPGALSAPTAVKGASSSFQEGRKIVARRSKSSGERSLLAAPPALPRFEPDGPFG